MKGDKRTQKDEDEYITNLRREEPIKTEIIVALRAQVKLLLENEARTLRALIADEKALALYRQQMLTTAEQILTTDDTYTLYGLPGYRWNNADGWHRTGEGT